MVIGEALMSSVVQAIGNSPLWGKTLLIINYDEHGGYYDHVAPPVALAPDNIAPIPLPNGTSAFDGYKRYGFRVPNVVISPWAKKNHISHMVYDHTSVLATIQRKWNLPAMTIRDANANDMLDYIDLDALRKGRMNFPDMSSLKLAAPGNTTQQLACSITGNAGVIPPVGSMINVTAAASNVTNQTGQNQDVIPVRKLKLRLP
jgi:phospholipase C